MTKYFTNNYAVINLYKKPSIKSEIVTQMIYGDWGIFFIITAVMVVPSLIFLYVIKDKLKLND